MKLRVIVALLSLKTVLTQEDAVEVEESQEQSVEEIEEVQ